jgi:hypothetical protein
MQINFILIIGNIPGHVLVGKSINYLKTVFNNPKLFFFDCYSIYFASAGFLIRRRRNQ